MKRFAILLFAVCIAWTASAQFSNNGPSSRVVTDTIYSDILKAEREFSVYLPKSYNVDKDKKYPVLYLLHGMNVTNTSWFRILGCKDIADTILSAEEACEMIIVAPNAGGNTATEWNGYFNMPGWAYEDFFFQEFLPQVEKEYRIIGDKKHRAVAGFSMGGGGALGYAQHRPDLFCAVYGMSALAGGVGGGRGPAQSSNQPETKMSLLTKSVAENDCIQFVLNADDATKEQLRGVNWYIDCGDDDSLLDRNIDLTREMKRARIPYQLRVREGGHTSEYWRSALYICLPFVSRCFSK